MKPAVIYTRISRDAEQLGLGFGVKFSNTLIVTNQRSFFPASEEVMYLSGPPLHVLALLARLAFRDATGMSLGEHYWLGCPNQRIELCYGVVQVIVVEPVSPSFHEASQGVELVITNFLSRQRKFLDQS